MPGKSQPILIGPHALKRFKVLQIRDPKTGRPRRETIHVTSEIEVETEQSEGDDFDWDSLMAVLWKKKP